MITNTEENYLKAIFSLNLDRDEPDLGTNEIAEYMGNSPATVSSKLKTLRTKKLINYKKYGDITLTDTGNEIALLVIRKHRLWETFLYEKMDFSWDEIHDVAEQLEHIKSKKLVDNIDRLLEYPKYDPHGDPIPNANGEIRKFHKKSLAKAPLNNKYKVVAVKDTSKGFLKYVSELGIKINTSITVKERREFDGSMLVKIGRELKTVTLKVGENVYIG